MSDDDASRLTTQLYCAAAAVFLVGILVLWGAWWLQAGCAVGALFAIIGARSAG